MPNNSYPARPGTKIEAIDIVGPVENGDFSSCRVEWVRAKEVTFVNCNFASAQIKSSYFHRASFVQCNFTGCSIVDSNFRGARFLECKFEYLSVRGTQIEASEFLDNLPDWDNAQRDLMRTLRKNAESLGDLEDARLCLAAEMRASEEHWRNAIKRATPYYRKHYPGKRGYLRSLYKLWECRIGRYVWGHGEAPLNLLLTLLAWLALCAIVMVGDVSGVSELARRAGPILGVFFGVTSAESASLSMAAAVVLAASRLIFIGLFVTVLVRRFARR